MNKRLLEAVATLTGTIIGAGILGLPYVFAKAGFLISFLWTLFAYAVVLILNLVFAEIVLRTNEKHQISGYIEKFLGKYGKFGKKIIIISMIVEVYGAILAYLVAQSNALYNLLGIDKILAATLMLLFVFFVVWFNIKAVEVSETIFSILVYLLLVGTPTYLLLTHPLHLEKLQYINIENVFLPLGPIFFAFLGTVAIPEVREELENNENLVKKAVVIGTTIPLILYTIFTVSIYLTFKQVPQVATFIFGPVGYLLTIVLTLCPFMTLSLALKETFMYDLKIPDKVSQLLVFIPPYTILLIFHASVNLFIKSLSLVGAVSMLTFAIPIILAHKNAEKFGDRIPEFKFKINDALRYLVIIILTFVSLCVIYLNFVK